MLRRIVSDFASKGLRVQALPGAGFDLRASFATGEREREREEKKTACVLRTRLRLHAVHPTSDGWRVCAGAGRRTVEG